MKITHFNNRTSVTFTLTGVGAEHVRNVNKVYEIAGKHKAQCALFQNTAPYKYSSKGELFGEQLGSHGGTITFHSHSCDHTSAGRAIAETLAKLGLTISGEYQEKVALFRMDGTPYKRPQTIIERI